MSRKENDFLKRLLVTFRGEAEERVSSLASGLIELEKSVETGTQAEVVEWVFREVHSLKGAARSVNFSEIEVICQAMEDVFDAVKRQKVIPTLAMLDVLHKATDVLKGLLLTIQSEPVSHDKTRHAALVRQIKELAKPAASNEALLAPPSLPAKPSPSPSPSAPPTPAPPVAMPEPPAPFTPEPLLAPPSQAPEQEAALRSVDDLEASDAQTQDAFESEWHLEAALEQGQHLRTAHPLGEERSASTPVVAETVRIATARLETLLLQIEELVSPKLAAGQRAAELREAMAHFDLWDKQWAKLPALLRALSQSLEASAKQSILPDGSANGKPNGLPNGSQNGEADKLHKQVKALLEFTEWQHTWVQQLDTRLTAITTAANHDQRTLGGMVDHLLQDTKQLLMLPFASILEIFPTVTRDLARQQGKEVQVVMRGTEIEVDRRILQEIKDPLMHLIRNCIDHGIETPDAREKKLKPRRGTITLTVAQQDSSKFEILVTDDGGGIDLAKVRNTAARLGLISPDTAERMGEPEAKALLFQSGFSTSPMITDLSGRGLGLAIVQEKVEKLGGTIRVESELGMGAEFHLVVPLTLATLRGLLVRSAGYSFILPVTHVERVARLPRREIKTVQNRETIQLAGEAFALAGLAHTLGLPTKSASAETSDRLFVVLLNVGEKRLAFAVDEIVGEQEVLMKGLGAQLARVRNIAGATVLGNGQVIPIINVPDLIKSAIRLANRPIESASGKGANDKGTKDKHILIVEDSITARMQLKNILELNGYSVRTAVDGMEALLTLRSEIFDLIVSDVDMPRLNGLDLTSRIRNDKRLAEIPVVLVTTLASREDQERGIEVGANAYITKSNFDQNKLLDAIRRLI